MEKESLEVIDAPENSINLVYEQPPFIKRCFGNFLDIIFLFLTFIAMFIAVQKTAAATPQYRAADNVVATYRKDSGLFEYSSKRKTWENISTYLDNNNDTAYHTRVYRCQLAIDNFITYVQTNGTTEQYEELVSNYDESRLSPKVLDSEGRNLFIKTTVEEEGVMVEKIVRNPEARAGDEYYYTHFYREYTLTNCGGYLISFFPEYQSALKSLSNILFFIQIPIAVFVSGVIIYFVPPVLIFRRGRSTFGKKLMQIGLVDSKVLNPSFGRYTARWAIFFFGELVLSLFSFGLPFIISFSMMVFSKRRQGFPDFMLGLTEVDTNKQKVYFSKYEIAVEHSLDHKEAIPFKLIEKE